MEDGRIRDSQITASSEWTHYYGVKNARLNHRTGHLISGAWSAQTNNIHQWIQVAFNVPRLVTGIVTQGRHNVDQWVTKFKVQTSDDGQTGEYVQNEKV